MDLGDEEEFLMKSLCNVFGFLRSNKQRKPYRIVIFAPTFSAKGLGHLNFFQGGAAVDMNGPSHVYKKPFTSTVTRVRTMTEHVAMKRG